jgi:hypothetical protein
MDDKFIGFDIETAPDFEMAEKLWKAPSRLKDPAKIADAKAEYLAEAALSPLTGRVVVIGLIGIEAMPEYLEGPEKAVLEAFWGYFRANHYAAHRFCFWSGAGNAGHFDIDFIVTRSRILGLDVPATARNGRYYGTRIVDLAAEFLLNRTGDYLSLTNAGEIFHLFDEGVTPACKRKKPDDPITGAGFALAYANGATCQAALDYLANDLFLLYHLAKAIL